MEVVVIAADTGVSCTVCVAEDETVGGLKMLAMEGLKATADGAEYVELRNGNDVVGYDDTTEVRHTDICANDELEVAIKQDMTINAPCQYAGHTEKIKAADITPCGKFLYTAGTDNTVRQWSTITGTCRKVMKRHTAPVYCVCASPAGDRAFSGGSDQTIVVWDTLSGKCETVFRGHMGTVDSLTTSRCGGRLFSAGFDKTIRVWDIVNLKSDGVLGGLEGWVSGLALCPLRGQTLYSCSWDKSIRYFNIRQRKCDAMERSETLVYSIALSPMGDVLYSSERAGIRMWSARHLRPLGTMKCAKKKAEFLNIVVTPSGTQVLGCHAGCVYIFDTTARACVATLQTTPNHCYVKISPCGEFIFTYGGTSTSVAVHRLSSMRNRVTTGQDDGCAVM